MHRALRRAAARTIGAAALAASCAFSSPARGQTAPDRSIVLPHLEHAPDVPYPEHAEGDAEVLLVLTIGKDGAVRAAEVQSGAEPFASAAKDAALGWHFVPGTRDGAPISVKIRFAVSFHAPAPPPEEAVTPAAPTAPSPASAGERAGGRRNEPIEVTVVGERAPPSRRTLTRAEVRQMPGTFGDPFRAIEALPGVTPLVSGAPYFYVRGAPPGNVGYYLDGVRVPYLYHVAIGPSVVHPAMVDRVDLYSGGYPAQYGRFAGAIVAAETTPPRTDWHGEANVRLFDAGAMLEGGFANGRGTALVGARYSYTAAILSLLSPTTTLDYRDYQARATYDVSPRDRLSVFAFGAYDLLATEKNNIETIVFGSEFYRTDLRYDHRLQGGGNLRWALTGGFDQTRIADQRNARDLLYGTRVEIVQPVGKTLIARGGVDAEFDSYHADTSRYSDPDDPDTKRYDDMFPPRVDGVAGAWADVVWKMDRGVELTPGVRLDVFRSNGASAVGVDPRLAMRVGVTDHVRLLHALGIAHQPPSFIIPIPGLALASLKDGLQTSLQASAGIEVDLPEKTTATVTLFDNVFLDMTDALGVAERDRSDLLGEQPRSLGSAYGLEVYVRRKLTRRLAGFLSYTLSRSTRRVGPESFPAAFDRTHVLNFAVMWDFGRGWSAGDRLMFYTGAPTLTGAPVSPFETRRSGDLPRDPSFGRIDFRVEKRWQLGGSKWLSFVAEMLNATLHKEVISGTEIGPVSIPSIGLEGGF